MSASKHATTETQVVIPEHEDLLGGAYRVKTALPPTQNAQRKQLQVRNGFETCQAINLQTHKETCTPILGTLYLTLEIQSKTASYKVDECKFYAFSLP